ncbi:MAG: radical SAM protein [Candidatus Sumerlaeota bacterium]|nr:radical SAM protein [Candidatus Sumerlaeota bacterium]
MAQRHRYQRVVFMEPMSTHIHVYSSVHIPRIGSILLSTLLRDKGYDVSVIVEDMLPRKISSAMVWDEIRQADLLCVSSITPTVQRCYEFCDRAREAGIPVIIGGTHASYFPDEAICHADWVMRGECDETFPLLMDTLDAGAGFDAILGLTWRDGGEVRHNPDQKLPPSCVLEANPYPDFDLMWKGNLHKGVISIAVARGCPFDCSFCSVTKFNGAAVRTVSAGRTLDMIEYYWNRYHPHYVFFAEDIFNQMKHRAKEIMRGLIQRRIRPTIGFGAQMRHEVVKDKEFLELLHAAKFDRAMIGFESVNQESLDLCGKRESVENIQYAINEFHRHKIKVHGMFVGGFDTDTPDTFRDTVKFAKKNSLDSFQIMLLTPLPGTRDWHTEGYDDGSRPLLTHEWSKYDGHHAVLVPKRMTAYEANLQALKAMRKFYTLPRAFGRLIKGDWVEFILRAEANMLIRKWFKTPANRQYLDMLKNQLKPSAADAQALRLAAAGVRRVIIAHTHASLPLKDKFEKFFNELGVRVEHSREGLGELLAQGQVKVGETRGKILEFLADHRLFHRDKTDLIVVPADCGNEMNINAVDIGGEAPLMVRLNINRKASVFGQQCVQIATRFTSDVLLAADAFRRTLFDAQQALAPAAQ